MKKSKKPFIKKRTANIWWKKPYIKKGRVILWSGRKTQKGGFLPLLLRFAPVAPLASLAPIG